MARWLVDGMNVVGSRPDGWWRDRDRAVRDLSADLHHFAQETGDEVAAIFDGREVDVPPGPARIDFARRRGRNAADDDIAAAAEADARDLVVVTSDARLAERVRAAGAGVEGAGAFRGRLARTVALPEESEQDHGH